MIAAVLCPGPSLVRTWPQPADVVLAVNRAAIAFPSDYWVALDYPLIREHTPIGSPALVTQQATFDSLAQRKQNPKTVVLVESLFDFYPRKMGWTRLTFSVAVVFAAYLGATAINVYGADWTSEPDFDGVQLESNQRHADRWVKEKALWDCLAYWLKQNDIALTRINHA